ncbi:hypothetical protein N7451_012607 [Penicillium sp. IBT 35674x]|nr:hypothetical protein N7451_012111 [Penicillium sp. IBT 35674x]KAJ5982507.1 hypothetical protein N7451_012607 [Penicillium sp. IBT 35674x]
MAVSAWKTNPPCSSLRALMAKSSISYSSTLRASDGENSGLSISSVGRHNSCALSMSLRAMSHSPLRKQPLA